MANRFEGIINKRLKFALKMSGSRQKWGVIDKVLQCGQICFVPILKFNVTSTKAFKPLVSYSLACLLLMQLAAMRPTIASEAPSVELCVQQSESAQPCGFELPGDVIDKLKIDAGFGWGIFSGSIYNGNSEYLITQLEVSMEPIHDHHHMEMMGDSHHMPDETRVHHIKMNLGPLTKGAISMALDDDMVHVHDFKWKVLKVFGYDMRVQ